MSVCLSTNPLAFDAAHEVGEDSRTSSWLIGVDGLFGSSGSRQNSDGFGATFGSLANSATKSKTRSQSSAKEMCLGIAIALMVITLFLPPQLSAAEPEAPIAAATTPHRSLADNRLVWPSREQILRVLSLRDYNTRIVLLGTVLLGICGGVVGTFMLLRKRSLVGDVVSHSSLPGIAIAFLVMESFHPGSGKSLFGLLAGALIAGIIGVLCTMAIRRFTRIKDDAAMAIVLSIFFGLGIALFTVVQSLPTAKAAGLHHFIFGKAASMTYHDVVLIGGAALVVLVISMLLFKEFSLLCFDEEYARTEGWPVFWLDTALMGLVVSVTVIGLQSVGLLLVVAMLIIPAAAARFWTDNLSTMTLISAALGGAGAFVGVVVSALFPRFAAGAVIVLVGSSFFAASLLFGTTRGVVRRGLVHRGLRRRIGRHDLLRAMYESIEPQLSGLSGNESRELPLFPVTLDQLASKRSWSASRLKRLVANALSDKLITAESTNSYRLTEAGAAEACRVVRNHRLWEMYLIAHADVAPSHVDRDADEIEHVLDSEVIVELESELAARYPGLRVPPSPHPIHEHEPVGASA